MPKMITFIYSFTKSVRARVQSSRSDSSWRLVIAAIISALPAVTVSCRDQPSEVRSPTGANHAPSNASQGKLLTRHNNTLLATLQANVNRALQAAPRSESRMTEMPRENSAGLLCSPARLDHKRSILRVDLPPRLDDRKGALVVLDPDGNLQIVYISYGIDTDPEDLIIPSKAIDWESARTRNSFIVDARSFDALSNRGQSPKPLFRKRGVYQLMLMNGFPTEIPTRDKRPFWVIGGCVIYWQN